VWNGHSCPLPLTLILTLVLNLAVDFTSAALSMPTGEAGSGRARLPVVPKPDPTVEQRRFSAA